MTIETLISNPLWLDLEEEPISKIRKFMKSLYKNESEIPGSGYYFSKLKGFKREHDPEITLDTYLKHIKKDCMIRFSVGRPEMDQRNRGTERVPAISLTIAGVKLPSKPEYDRMAWYYCPLSQENFNKVDELFKNVYGCGITQWKKLSN